MEESKHRGWGWGKSQSSGEAKYESSVALIELESTYEKLLTSE